EVYDGELQEPVHSGLVHAMTMPPTGATGARSATVACPNCQAPVTLGLPFCPSCGSRVMTPGPGPACPHCGMPATPGTKYCGACGKQLSLAPAAVTAPKLAAPLAPPPPPPSNTRLLVVDEKGTVLSKHPIGQ